MSDADMRGTMIGLLEEAQTLAETLGDGATGYLIERALDETSAGQFRVPPIIALT